MRNRPPPPQPPAPLTPQELQQLAEKVYRLLCADLRLERARLGRGVS